MEKEEEEVRYSVEQPQIIQIEGKSVSSLLDFNKIN